MASFPFARRLLGLAVLVVLPWMAAHAGENAAPPVSTAELCLLLRSGSTPAEVLRDTAGRPLLAPLDTNAERLLREAGADPDFIDTLRRTRPLATATQTRDEHARQDALARQRLESWETNQAHLVELGQAALAASLATRAQEAQQNMANRLRGKLIVYRDQRFQNYDDALLTNKKQFALYFATLADSASHKFTPRLVKFYEQYAAAHPEFELVFISKDYSGLEMESDVRAYPMPWPALAYSRLAEEKDLTKPGDGPLPRLLVIDGTGRLLLDSVVDGQYVGPQHVLDELPRRAEAATAQAAPATASR